MRTRQGFCYLSPEAPPEEMKRKRTRASEPDAKRPRAVEEVAGDEQPDAFDLLHDDIVLCIFSRLASSAARPLDLVAPLLTCKRFNRLVSNRMVLSKASARSLALRAKNWSESADRFLLLCARSGNRDAYYILGMIRFYCLGNYINGMAMMARAALGWHAEALYSLAVIQFNGSGAKNRRDLRAAVLLCARAAYLGHVDSIRELGHCFQDGYGVRRNIAEGHRLLVHANVREVAAVLFPSIPPSTWLAALRDRRRLPSSGRLRRDFGCNVPVPEPHPANRFLTEWFAERGGAPPGDKGLRLCSNARCGRAETRRHEFRRCSVCGGVNYCSRACQALDWKLVHSAVCVPTDIWFHEHHQLAAAAAVAAAEAN